MGSKWTPEKQEKVRRTNEVRRIVDRYLQAIEQQSQPARRERLTLEELSERAEQARQQADDLAGVKRLKKLQEAQDYQARAGALDQANSADLEALETEFIGVAAEFSEKNGIGADAWREAGVSVAVLRAAGIDNGG